MCNWGRIPHYPSFIFLPGAFHCTMNFKVKKEGLMLGFKDQFRGNDDKV
jgi:hypothetical protein